MMHRIKTALKTFFFLLGKGNGPTETTLFSVHYYKVFKLINLCAIEQSILTVNVKFSFVMELFNSLTTQPRKKSNFFFSQESNTHN